MSPLSIVPPALVIVVGIIAAVFGGWDTMLSSWVYLLVCLLALWQIIPLLRAGSAGSTGDAAVPVSR